MYQSFYFYQHDHYPFKIVPLGSYIPMETLFPLLVAALEVCNWYGLQQLCYNRKKQVLWSSWQNRQWATIVSKQLSMIIFTGRPLPPSPNIFFRSLVLSMLLNYKKFSSCLIDWQLSIPNVIGHAYFYPLPPLWRWGFNLDLNGIERVVIPLSILENYVFDIVINEYFHWSPFLYGW